MHTHPPMPPGSGSNRHLRSGRFYAEQSLLTPAVLILSVLLVFPILLVPTGGTKENSGALPGQRPDLVFELSLSKVNVVRGESVPFVLTLSNQGKSAANLRDESPENQAFSVQVSGPGGFHAEANTASVLIREGEHVDVPRVVPRRTLLPGEAMRASGDLISWIGELEPGNYSVTAQYADGATARQAAKPVSIHIEEASPVSSIPMRNPLFAEAPAESLWLNRSAQKYDLFLQLASASYPPVTLSSRRISTLSGPFKAVISMALSSQQKIRHVVWINGSGQTIQLNVVRLTGLVPETISGEYAVPEPVPEILDLPFTDESGTLFVVLVDPDGSASLFALSDSGRPSRTPLPLPSPMTGPRRSLWCRDGSLVLCWADGKQRQISFATVAPSAPARKPVVRRITAADFPVLDICLFQRYRESDSGYDRIAAVLFRDESENQLIRRIIHLDTGKTESETRFPATAALRWSLLEAVRTGDSGFRYLFASADGSVHFANSDFSRISPLVSPSGKPIRRTDCPSILIASEFSRLPGTYIRYIEDGKRFAWLQVE
jgi:hypothetical protein